MTYCQRCSHLYSIFILGDWWDTQGLRHFFSDSGIVSLCGIEMDR